MNRRTGQEEEVFRTVYEHAATAIAIADLNERLERCNPAFRRLLGYTDADLRGIQLVSLIHSDDSDAYLAAMRRLRAGEINQFELDSRYLHKDGRTVWVHMFVSTTPANAGELGHIISLADITGRKRTELALREREAQLQIEAKTLATLNDLSSRLWRAPGLHDGLNEILAATIDLLGADAGYVQLFGAERAMLRIETQRGFTDEFLKRITHPSAADNSPWARALRTGTRVVIEDIEEDPDCGPLWSIARAAGFRALQCTPLLGWNRTPVGMLSTYVQLPRRPDNSDLRRLDLYSRLAAAFIERWRAEDALASARRLEAVGQLAGGVAHDFNNLLAVIAGNLELAERRIDDTPSRQLIRHALDAAEAGGSFTRRLLSLARRRKLEPQRLILTSRVEETLKLLGRTIGEHIELASQLADNLWPTVADPAEIDSALVNLALNARDAMPRGGRILISATNVSFDEGAAKLHPDARSGDYVRVSVADTGAGMCEEVLSRALEPFFTTKEPGKGTGLGLSSVASFAKQSGGFVTLASEVGRGTTVSIYLCRAREDAPSEAVTAVDLAPMGNGELVLVVEDDDKLREVTLKRLESLGYAVGEARTGAEAIEHLQTNEPIELVLCDIVMPGGMTGYDVARWVATNKPEIKVILNSGYNESDRADDAQKTLGDVTILAKPYTRIQLARVLRGTLEHAA